MNKPGRICTATGCPSIATQGTRCASHPFQRKGKAWDHKRSARQRGYDSSHHAMRRRVLAEQPLCTLCEEPATIADHITPLSRGGTHDRANYQGLCKRCSDRKTQAEAAAGRRRARHSR